MITAKQQTRVETISLVEQFLQRGGQVTPVAKGRRSMKSREMKDAIFGGPKQYEQTDEQRSVRAEQKLAECARLRRVVGA